MCNHSYTLLTVTRNYIHAKTCRLKTKKIGNHFRIQKIPVLNKSRNLGLKTK